VSENTQETTPTQFIKANGIRYSYRRFGDTNGALPLVCLPHYRGTMDSWDPAVTNTLARDREIVIFDSAGIGRSGGTTPDNVPEMTIHALAVIEALGLTRIDLLGFSLGGFIAQQIVLNRPSLTRRLVLAGTAPRGGDGFSPFSDDVEHLATLPKGANGEDRLALFFASSESSKTAGRAYMERLEARQDDREPHTTLEVMRAHHAAIYGWGKDHHGDFNYLRDVKLPVLVVNGQSDIMIPTANSYTLQKNLPNSQLIIYPDSAHAALFQYVALFSQHVSMFLGPDSEWPSA
jgi:pimeloyl-ACP methyl ester carboxylesterase